MERSIPSPANVSRLAARPVAIALVTGAGIVVAATLALWAHYGSAVFYEMIATGLAACF
jgi:hypothetical protein